MHSFSRPSSHYLESDDLKSITRYSTLWSIMDVRRLTHFLRPRDLGRHSYLTTHLCLVIYLFPTSRRCLTTRKCTTIKKCLMIHQCLTLDHGYPPTHSYTPTHGYPPTHSYYPVHGYPPTYGYPPTFHVPQLPSYPLPYGYPCGEPHNHPSPSVKRMAHINYPLALVHQTWLAGDPDPMLISEIHLFLKAPRLNIRALTLAISHLPRFQQTIQLNHIFSPLQYTSWGSQEEYTVTSHRNDGDRRSRKRNHNRSDGSHRYTQEYSKPIVH